MKIGNDRFFSEVEGKVCYECGCPVGPCTEYMGNLRCIGCWVEFDCNIRPVKTKDLIERIKKAMENENRPDITEVNISYSDAIAILNKLEEKVYMGQDEWINRNGLEEFIVKKYFFEEIIFREGAIYKRFAIEGLGFDVDFLLKDGYIERKKEK